MDSVDEFLFGANTDLTQHGSRHFAEEVLNQIQPGTVFGNENEVKPLWPCCEVPLRFPRDMRRMVVQNQAQGLRGRISSVKLRQELDEVAAFVRIVHDLGHLTGVQIEAGQQRYRAKSLIFVVPEMAGVCSGRWRPVGSRHSQRLNSRLLVVGNRHCRRFANGA